MRALAPFFAWATLIAACAAAPALFPELEQADVEAITSSGTHRFRVWIADDDESRERGMMNVRELPADRGMLFMFDAPRQLAFWMKDTYLPLDLVFIGADGRVLNIAANTRPLSLNPIFSRGEAIATLELLGGTSRRIGLTPGDRISLPSLRTTGKRDSRDFEPRTGNQGQN
jgi:uncharacterized membrane protein (UPF0127 family)